MMETNDKQLKNNYCSLLVESLCKLKVASMVLKLVIKSYRSIYITGKKFLQ